MSRTEPLVLSVAPLARMAKTMGNPAAGCPPLDDAPGTYVMEH